MAAEAESVAIRLVRAACRAVLDSSSVQRISKPRFERLAVAIQTVLTKAIQAGGTSLRDFLKEDGTPGYFRHELKVYGREGECCEGCGGGLKSLRITGRATVYCPVCQR